MSAEWNDLMLAVDGPDRQMPPEVFLGTEEEKQAWHLENGLLRRREQRAQKAQE